MKKILLVILLACAYAISYGQTRNINTANIQISGLPANIGGGKFQVVGVVNDIRGLMTASNITVGMIFQKGNSIYPIDSIYSVVGSTITLRVVDVDNTGFISGGAGSILGITSNFGLPGVPPTGDSNSALTTPADYTSILNHIISLIDTTLTGFSAPALPKVYDIDSVGDTTSISNPAEASVAYVDTTEVYFRDSTNWKKFKVYPSISGVAFYEYEVASGVIVTATDTTLTFTRTGGAGQNTEGTLNVPDGVYVHSLTVHFTAGQAPGTTYYLNVNRYTLDGVNISQNTSRPVWVTVATKPTTFADVTPATNYVHSGTPIQIGISTITNNTTYYTTRYIITNYNQQVGSAASMVSYIFQ